MFDELQTGKGFVSRQFDYHTGKATDEHKDNDKLKSTPTTQLVREIIFSDGRTIEYEYDAEERITKVTDSIDGVIEYTYDALGQLLTETKNGAVVNRMVYDSYGNIIQKNDNNYVYDNVWKDKLAYYNGNAIEYDEQGNPTSYLRHTLAWEKGRQLKSFDDISFTYNANGIRTSKTVDGTTHTYTLDGTKILKETWDDNTLETIFDNEDAVCGIIYNNVPYYFVKNLQGDIIAITNENGEVVVRYSYDAWGKCTIEQDYSLNGSIATVNPYRYRGYYYDKETELYYLQSRYYDAEVGRFVNADEPIMLVLEQEDALGNNLFIYCENCPISYIDLMGFWAEKLYNFEPKSFGFIADVSPKFLSATYCYSYAADVYSKYKKNKKYPGIKKMGILRMAVEIYAHALAFYVGSIMVKFGIARGAAYVNHGEDLYINYGDKWTYKYWIVWGMSRTIKILLLNILVTYSPHLYHLVQLYM